MKLSKWPRRIFAIVLFAFLLILPRLAELHYLAFYYVLVAILLTLYVLMDAFKWHEKSDERFRVKWKIRRNKGFWFHFFPALLGWFLYTWVVVLLGQLFGNGYSPIYIFRSLNGGELVLVFGLALFFSSLVAVVSWFENEKRYRKICSRDSSVENETH